MGRAAYHGLSLGQGRCGWSCGGVWIVWGQVTARTAKTGLQFKSVGECMVRIIGGIRTAWRKILPVKWSVYGWTIVAVIIGLTLGTYLAASWESETPAPVTRPEGSRQQVADTILGLESEQAELKKLIGQLREQIDQQQSQLANAKTTLTEIGQELEAQKRDGGMVALKGPGLIVTVDDSASQTIPAGDDPSLYIVHEYHLRDVVNALWQSGAEAVAINGERLVGSTSVYCVGSTIMVNSTRLSPPYEIVAIGDPSAMEIWLNNPSVLQELKTRCKVYGLQFKTARSDDLTVPSYTGSLAVKYTSSGTKK